MFFGIGISLHFFNSDSSEIELSSSTQTAVFKISKKLNSNEKSKKYEVKIQADKQNFDAVLYIPKSEKELDFIHYYKTKVYISKVKLPQYDFQFNYARYLQRKNIQYQCYANEQIFSSERNDLSVAEKFSQKRLNVLKNIDSLQMSQKSKEFLKGIILADRTEIDSVTVKDFNRSGLVHFLAISGTHIVIIFGLFFFLLDKVLPLQFRKYAIISSLLFIWLFTVFIGFGSSVVRSSIMLSVFSIYVLLQRKPDLLHSLSLSAFVILVFDTQQIFDVGFQLSFLAVLGIFWLNQPILNYLPKQTNRLKKIIFNTISISLAAQLATLPLVLFYFHQFSLISIIANFFIVPFSEIIIIFSFIMTALVALSLDFGILNLVYDFIIRVLLEIIHWFADFNSLFFENISMNLFEALSLFIVIFMLRFLILKYNFKNTMRFTMAVLFFFIVRIGFNCYENNRSEILVHHFSKREILSIKSGSAAVFWIDESINREKAVQFVINPYCSSRRLSDVKINILPVSTQKIVYHGKIYEIR